MGTTFWTSRRTSIITNWVKGYTCLGLSCIGLLIFLSLSKETLASSTDISKSAWLDNAFDGIVGTGIVNGPANTHEGPVNISSRNQVPNPDVLDDSEDSNWPPGRPGEPEPPKEPEQPPDDSEGTEPPSDPNSPKDPYKEW